MPVQRYIQTLHFQTQSYGRAGSTAELGERVLAGKHFDEHVGTASCNHHKTSQLLFDQVGAASTVLFISIYYSFPGCGPSELLVQKPILPVAENHGDEIPRALCVAWRRECLDTVLYCAYGSCSCMDA